MSKVKTYQYLTWAEIDLKAAAHNFRQLEKLAQQHSLVGKRGRAPKPGALGLRLLPVIKADAYGHGMLAFAQLLTRLGADFLAVSDVPEGLVLRQKGVAVPILLLEATLPTHVRVIVENDLTPSVCTWELATAFSRVGRQLCRTVKVHMKVDTGMSRLGVACGQAKDFIKKVAALPNIVVEGVFSHFPVADSDAAFTRQQIGCLATLLDELRREGITVPYVHAANSMGLSHYRHDIFTLARPGLMLYGLYPAETVKKKLLLKPVMSVKTRIIFLKEVEKGRGISYGHTFVALRRMKIATLPIGYSDGFLRCLSNKATVLVAGKRCPLVGRVTMDQIMVDVSAVPAVRVGQEVVIIGRQKGQEITADDVAAAAGTINYEIACSLGNRLVRVYR